MTAETFALRRIGETLRAVVDDGALVELHLARAHDRLPLHSVHDALVREKTGARLQVDIDGDEAWLIGAPDHPLGTRLTVRVTRAPIPEPGQIKRAHVVVHHGPAPVPSPAQDVAGFPDAFEIDEWCDRAISGAVPFECGTLSLERTRAGLVIDVDGHGVASAVNTAAAAMIARLLRLFQVGGMVLVDFVTLPNRAERLALDAALDSALKRDPRPCEHTAINGYGMVQIVRARPGPSLIDTLCGTRRAAPSLATQALQLLNEAAASRGAGTRTLRARAEILRQIESHPSWLDALRAALGADVQLTPDQSQRDHGQVHVTPV